MTDRPVSEAATAVERLERTLREVQALPALQDSLVVRRILERMQVLSQQLRWEMPAYIDTRQQPGESAGDA